MTARLQNMLYSALHTSSSLPRIQQTLNHELSAAGWTNNLRIYVLQLLRSGECTTYDEVMERVLKEARGEPRGTKAINGAHSNGTNGITSEAGKSVEEGGIRIPENAVKEGIKAVKKELQKACDIAFEDEE
jgi:hypothetical protein